MIDGKVGSSTTWIVRVSTSSRPAGWFSAASFVVVSAHSKSSVAGTWWIASKSPFSALIRSGALVGGGSGYAEPRPSSASGPEPEDEGFIGCCVTGSLLSVGIAILEGTFKRIIATGKRQCPEIESSHDSEVSRPLRGLWRAFIMVKKLINIMQPAPSLGPYLASLLKPKRTFRIALENGRQDLVNANRGGTRLWGP